MRSTCVAVLISVALAMASKSSAEDKPVIPAGAISVDDLKKQSASQIAGRTVVPVPKPMSQSRSSIGQFFHRLFGPSETKINGTVIQSAQTYKNGIAPLPPIVPR